MASIVGNGKQARGIKMTVEERQTVKVTAYRTLDIEPLANYEREQLEVLDELARHAIDTQLLRAAWWLRRAERLGVD